MAIGTVTWGSVNAANGSNCTPGYPASPAAGDLLLLFVYNRQNNASAFSTPSGWTQLVQTATANGTYAIFYKEAVGDESGTVSGFCNTSDTTIGRIALIPGAAVTSIISGSATAETEAASTSISNAGVSPTDAGSLIVLFTAKGDGGNNTTNDYSAWAGNSLSWSGVANGSTLGGDAAIGIGYAVKSNTGATGALTCTATLAFVGISYAFAIKEKPPVEYTETRNGTAAGTGAASDSRVVTETASATGAGTGAVTDLVPANYIETCDGTATVAGAASSTATCTEVIEHTAGGRAGWQWPSKIFPTPGITTWYSVWDRTPSGWYFAFRSNGSALNLYRSNDGVTWELTGFPTWYSTSYAHSINNVDGRLIAVVYYNSATVTFYESFDDGATWGKSWEASLGQTPTRPRILVAGGLYLIARSSGLPAWSTDLVTWNAGVWGSAGTPQAMSIIGRHPASGRFYGRGYPSVYNMDSCYSDDGKTWYAGNDVGDTGAINFAWAKLGMKIKGTTDTYLPLIATGSCGLSRMTGATDAISYYVTGYLSGVMPFEDHILLYVRSTNSLYLYTYKFTNATGLVLINTQSNSPEVYDYATYYPDVAEDGASYYGLQPDGLGGRLLWISKFGAASSADPVESLSASASTASHSSDTVSVVEALEKAASSAYSLFEDYVPAPAGQNYEEFIAAQIAAAHSLTDIHGIYYEESIAAQIAATHLATDIRGITELYAAAATGTGAVSDLRGYLETLDKSVTATYSALNYLAGLEITAAQASALEDISDIITRAYVETLTAVAQMLGVETEGLTYVQILAGSAVAEDWQTAIRGYYETLDKTGALDDETNKGTYNWGQVDRYSTIDGTATGTKLVTSIQHMYETLSRMADGSGPWQAWKLVLAELLAACDNALATGIRTVEIEATQVYPADIEATQLYALIIECPPIYVEV